MKCKCATCLRSRRWKSEKDKTKLFSEMCDIIASSEFEEQMTKFELDRMREYLVENNEYDNYIKWRRS